MFIHEAILALGTLCAIPTLVGLVIWICHMRSYIKYLKSDRGFQELGYDSSLAAKLSNSQCCLGRRNEEIKQLKKIIRTGKSQEFNINEIKEKITKTKQYLKCHPAAIFNNSTQKFIDLTDAKKILCNLKKQLKQAKRRK